MTTAILRGTNVSEPRRKSDRYPRYTPTGVLWLGEMPAHWKNKRLRFVVTFPSKAEVRGLRPETPVSFVPMESVGEFGGLTLDQTRPLEDVINGYTYFRNGDVLVAKITPCFENGKGAIAENLENRIGFGTTELHVLRAGKEILPRFLFYLTQGEHFRKLGTAEMYGAGGQKRVPESFLKDIRHPLPPLDEQREIARFLDREIAKLDGLIAKKQQLVTQLAIKREAKIAAVFTTQADDTVRLPIKRLLTFTTSGSRGWAEFYSDEGDLFIQSGNLNRRLGLDLSVVQRIKPPEGAEAQRTMIRRGDILVCVTGAYTGNVAVVDFDPPRAFINQHVALLRLRQRIAAPKFVAYFLASSIGQGHFKACQYGGTKQGLGFEDIHSIAIPLLPLDKQLQIVRQLDSALRAIQEMTVITEAGVAKLREFRSSLVSVAVTGQVDVRNYRSEATCQ